MLYGCLFVNAVYNQLNRKSHSESKKADWHTLQINLRFFMKKKIGAVLSILFVVLFTQASQNSSDAQNAMEEALKGFTTIQQLVSNSSALNQYYQAVNAYYQEKIPRDKFDIIMNQLLVLTEQDPDFNRRAFAQQDALPEYEITSDVKTYGRNLNFQLWNSFEESIFLSKTETPTSLDGLTTQLQAVADQIAQFEAQIATVSKKQAGQQRATFYSKIKNENIHLFKQVVSYIYHYDSDIRYLSSQMDADFVFYIFDYAIKEKIKELSVPDSLKSLLSASLPKTSDLLSNKDLFPIAYTKNKNDNLVPAEPIQSVTYRFTPFKKRIHAVWKGIWLKECVGGGDEWPTPRRWATALLNSVYNYSVEKNKSFVGFIQELGMQRKGSQSTYYAVEFGAPNLKESIMVKGDRKIPQKVIMLDKWLELAPKSRVRIKSGNYLAIDNAAVLPTLRSSNYWNFRKEIGSASDYQLLDQAFADQIIDLSVKNNFEPKHKYGDGIISDATLGSSGKLTVVAHANWTKSSLEKYLRKKITSSEELTNLITTNQEIVDQLDFDSIFQEIYERLAMNSTDIFIDLLNAARQKNLNKPKFISMLMNDQHLDNFAKITVVIKTMGVNASIEYAKQLRLDSTFVDKIMSQSQISGVLLKNIHQALFDKILNEKLIHLYNKLLNHPVVRENSTNRSQFYTAIVNVPPAHQDILSSVFSEQSFYQLYNVAQESYRVRLYDLAKNSGLSEVFRRNAIMNGSLNAFTFNHGELYIRSNSAILQDIIDHNSESLLANFFTNNNKDQYFDLRQMPEFVALVNLVLNSNKANLIALLSSEHIKTVYARIKNPNQELNGKALEHYKKLMLPSQVEVNKPLSAMSLFKQGSQLSYQDVIKAKVQSFNQSDKLMIEILRTNQPEKLHLLQTQVTSLLGQQDLSTNVIAQIKSFLKEQKNNENWRNTNYQILVIFELSAKFEKISDEIYELAKNLAEKVLSEPQFQKHAAAYKPLFESRSQRPAKCINIFL